MSRRFASVAGTGALPDAAAPDRRALRVTIVGGGPVGLTLALLLDHHMGASVAVTIHDGRWIRTGGEVEWRGAETGNVRRRQVVTVQSRRTASSCWRAGGRG